MNKIQYIFVLSFVILNFAIHAQQEAYNEEFEFEIISSEEVLENRPEIEALRVNFVNDETLNFCKSLKNNPQLREVQLYGATQDAINCLSSVLGEVITHLLIYDCVDSIVLPSFPNLSVLIIESHELVSLDMTNSVLDSLAILAINSEKLVDWKSKHAYAQLELIDLNSPNLNTFPIHSLPRIYQLSLSASFDQIPSFLCECGDLELISIDNNKNISVDDCFKEKILNGYYSNLTIREGENGLVILEYLSKDRQ